MSAEPLAPPAALPIEQQRRLLASLLARRSARPRSYAASHQQTGLWLLQQLEPASPAYNVAMALRLTGALRPAALALSLSEIVRRHWTLRTRFSAAGDAVVQEVAPAAEIALPFADLARLPPAARACELARRLDQAARRPFDLSQAPLLRAGLLRVTAQEHVVYLVVHHVVFDGWSMGVLVRELAALYPAFAHGEPSPLAPPPLQYVDYAAWQRRRMARGEIDPDLAYWRDRLLPLAPPLALPADRPRPARLGFAGAARAVALPDRVAAALGACCRQVGASLFMALLAGFCTLLCRLTGQDDLAIGSPVAQRNCPELEGLIGCFVNAIVLRIRPRIGDGFRALLAEVKETALAAFAHQDLPFEKLVEELRPERDLSRSPLFQAMLILQNAPLPAVALPGLTLTPVETPRTTARFDLLLDLSQTPAGIGGLLEYSTELFTAPTAERLVCQFGHLLAALAADPDRPLAELPLLGAGERFQLVAEWNDTASLRPAGLCIHHLFAPQAARTPQAVALVDRAGSLTYGELERRANRLALVLRAAGIGPETLVGVLLDRSTAMVVALLAILKAGGAYLPLDPGHPKARTAFILEDAAPALVLTEDRLRDLLPQAVSTLCLEDAERLPRPPDPAPPDCLPGGAFGQHLAYVIYTSGSTGKPKGVEVHHDAMVNLLLAMRTRPGLGAADTLLAVTTLAFDIAGPELLLPLTVGARVVIAAREAAADGQELAASLVQSAATMLQATPATWRLLLAAGWRAADAFVALCCGEALPRELADQLLAAAGRLWNLYGPTETTVFSALEPVAAGGHAVSIGRPLANTEVHVVDRGLQPQPIGVPGEVLLGGAGLARGYRNRPDLTAERFIPNPFGAAGSRLYRSGDLAAWRPDGSLDFLGRVDHQVKIRGFRIEVEEIESVLLRQPAVAAAAVAARRHPAGDRLVAYLVARRPAVIAIDELRSALRNTLPDYMMPAAFVELDAMPLNPSGKLDRSALPEAASATEPGAAGRTPPRTALEEVLAEIWAQVLGTGRPGTHDNLFELGAHSLLAAQVLARLNRELGVDLPLRRIFELPTIDLLAAEIERRRGGAARSQAPPLRAVTARDGAGLLPLSFAQQRLWFFDRWQPGSAVFNLPTAVDLVGEIDVRALAASCQLVVGRHDALRSRFLELDGEPRLVVDPCTSRPFPPFPVVDIGTLPPHLHQGESERLARAAARAPFDLARGPLLHTLLVRRAPGEHLALLTLHHIIADGWSLWIFAREVSETYAAIVAGRRPRLPRLPVQFADYAAWQRQWLTGEVLASELGFWKEQLAGLPAALGLTGDRPRGPAQRFRGRRRGLTLPPTAAAGLRTLGRDTGGTLFMALLAAWATLLWHHSGQPDVATGTVFANRHRGEVEGLIGLFINTVVLRTRLAPAMTFRQAVPAIREVTLDAFAHQDVPFEKLVEELNPERHPSLPPLFQVMLVLQNTPAAALELPGVRLAMHEMERDAVNYDLVFFLDERGGGLRGSLDYDADLFDAPTIDRLLVHFANLCAAMVEDPGRPLRDALLLSPGERQQLLHEWNDSATTVSDSAATVDELFLRQAAARPEACAAACGGERITYRELAARVERLARALAGRGVEADDVVPVLMERDIALLTAILAILRAGAAYLPLDPAHPDRRLAQIVSAAGSAWVLASRGHAARLAAACAAIAPAQRPRIEIQEDLLAAPPAAAAARRLPRRALPEALAYVIFTSGSTGQPKGVMVCQRGLLNNLRAKIDDLPLSARDVVAQTASQCFDISVWQFLAAPLAGGTVHIVPDGIAHDPGRLLAEIERAGTTVLEIVPTLLQAALDEAERADPAGPALAALRWVMPTGEAVPADLCRRWLARHPAIPLLNLYGPSECSDDVSCQAIRTAAEAGDAVAPIGRPLRNVQLHVVDPALAPVPIGVPGELAIGGAGVGRGYLFDPARTAAAFVPDAHSGAAGARLYRTGDLARTLADGRIEFLGRLDRQIKMRGFRIETSEIEAVLRQHEEVDQAVVVAHRAGGARLLGYVTSPPGTRRPGDLPARLRAHVAERLPDYMVPALFVPLARLPLLTSGKIDLRALPEPAPAGGAARAAVAPRTRTERQLAEIWRELLGREEIGVEDSFFDLGGHSLLALQVLARLRTACGVDLPLPELFEAATLAALAARVDEASSSPFARAAPPITRRPPGPPPPLSFAQERLWFLDQLEPASPAYNLPSAVLLEGAVDAALLKAILRAIVGRHEALRTTFTVADGRPRQQVHAELPPPLPVICLRALPAATRERETVRLATLEAQLPFDLARGPLLRAWLLERGPAEHVLLLDLHHIVSDAWSAGVFLTEVGLLYEAVTTGRPPRLPELPVQYPDFACWQRATFTDDALAGQLRFWQDRFADPPATLELPLRATAPATLCAWRGGTRRLRLGDGLAAGLRRLGQERGTTLFMTLFAGFAALLARYSQVADLPIGVPVAGRSRTELERLIGFFVNTLAVRADLSGGPSGELLLARVRRLTLDAFAHQDLPFERLVAALNPDRNLDRSPLFQVMFALQNVALPRLQVPGLVLHPLQIPTGTTRFELFLEMSDGGGAAIEGALHYSSDRFEAPFIARFLAHFEALLVGLAAAPERAVAALPLLSRAEQMQLQWEWNDTGRTPLAGAAHQLFAAQAARHPDRIAAACDGQSVSYAELDRRTDGLARRLHAHGLGAEGVAAVLAERGLGLLAAMLGVWRAGGAYLPLDPQHPPRRTWQVLAESRCPVVLVAAPSRPALAAALTVEPAAPVPALLELEALLEATSAPAGKQPAAPTPGERLAYVIFTSGSTGVPKGAMVAERGMVNHLQAKIVDLGLTAADVVAQTASQCFDISIWQLLAPLVLGGRVEIYPDRVAHDPAALLARAEADAVSVLETVPSLLRLMLDEIRRQGAAAPRLAALRWLIPTGEALPPSLCRDWYRAYPHTALLNAYGPTECSDDVSHHRVTAADAAARSVPIGRPVLNTQLYVMDGNLQPVPSGVIGELCAGGAGVGRGYLHDPRRTAAVFVPDPCAYSAPGARLYRTGDLARQRTDGSLDFLGRRDHQVKVRGFRLELQEIEALLSEHPEVAAAVVTAVPEGSGALRLVAYTVPAAAAAPPRPPELREHLRSRLPDYAVPTAWVTLESLPLSPSGKLDRHALPPADAAAAERERPFTAPRGGTEEKVAAVFATVIGIDGVGAHHDFFDLGGHSLLATQALSRLRECFGVDLELRVLFEAPTVAALAAVIEDRILAEIETLSDDEVDSLLAPGAAPPGGHGG